MRGTPSTAGNGHRKRLLERFTRNGIDSLHPHEIVELALSFVIARRDTKTMAHELLDRYKSIGSLLNAPRGEIAKTTGIGERSAAFLTFIGAVASYSLREKFEHKSYITHRRDVEEYLRFAYGTVIDEYVTVLYLGNRNQVIASPMLARGTVNQCVVHPRVILENALRYGATALIIVHNHPGGTMTPSEADWLLTVRCYTLCALMDLALHDHLIVCRTGVVSLKELPRWPGKVV